MSGDCATLGGKPRVDAWDAGLSEGQRWAVYDRLRRGRWYEVAEWAAGEFGLEGAPSRSAMFRFAGRMRQQEGAHRVASALLARDEAGALVAAATDDGATVAAYKAFAQDLALRGDAELALKYTSMALALAGQQVRERELELRGRAQETRDAQLRLAEEKFKASEARLGEVKVAVADASLSPDEREARLREIFGL